jgi:pyruvate/2-oxoglutarate dehydrogenase complex dihydrolipoamide acyltransferase (E2) component
MWASRKVPLVIVDRECDLSAVIAARAACEVRPQWTVIFAKAFAIAATAEPRLRQSWISFPWAYLYEHAEPVAAVTLEREVHGEPIVFIHLLRQLATRPLAELDAELREMKHAENPPGLRRSRRIARFPLLIRRFLYWIGLHTSGRIRERQAGTFAVTSVASAGAGAIFAKSPLTATLHYSLFRDNGHIDLRLTFDHRVFDGAVAARALVQVEQILKTTILEELLAGADAVAKSAETGRHPANITDTRS